MWKRETKLGLVVSGSFLCLLGAMLGRKLLLHETPPSQDGGSQAVAQGPENPKAGTGSEPGIFPLTSVKHEEIKTLPASPDPGGLPSAGSSILPNLPGSFEPAKAPAIAAPGPPAIPDFTPPPGDFKFNNELEKAAKEAKMGKFANNPKKKEKFSPVPDMPPAMPGPIAMAPGPFASPISDQSGPPAPPAMPAEVKPLAPPTLPAGPPSVGNPGTEKLPVPGVVSAIPADPPTVAGGLPAGPPAIPNNPYDKKDTTPALPIGPPAAPGSSGEVKLPPPGAVIPPAPPAPGGQPVKIEEFNKNAKPMGPPIPIPDVPEPQNKGADNPVKPPVQPPAFPAPPVGADPKIPAGPVNGITVPVVTAQDKSAANPPVQEYSLERYQWQPGMTFPILCKQKYEHEKYADALLLFNRDFPGGSIWLKQNPPIVKPGETIFIPQLVVLQTKYANFIPKGPAAAATPSYSAKPPDGPGAVAPPFAPPGVAAFPVKVSDAPASGLIQQTASGPIYTVVGDKEMIFEIAQKTLGEGRRWTEIWYLNRQMIPDPSRPIPAGTQLRLPGKK